MEEELTATGRVISVYPDDHVDPPESHGLVGAVVITSFVLLVVALMLRWRELGRAAEAETAFDPSAPLLEGARFVRGTVELAEGTDTALKVAMEQRGSESKGKHGWSHTWTEMDRQITANPFYLRRDDGKRVRVEPGATALLVDAVDQVVWTDRTSRTRTAELTAGEEAICEGVLRRGPDPEERGRAGGYRDTVKGGWVMRPLPGERLHVSTEELAERHRIKARRYRGAALFIVGMQLIVALSGSTYFARALLGEPARALITGVRHYTTRDSKGHTHHHHVLDLAVRREDGRSFSAVEDLDSSDWMRFDGGEVVSYLAVDEASIASATGRGSSVHVWAWIFMLIATTVGGFALLGAHQSRRWYEGKLVDTGKGRLPVPPGATLPS